MKGELIWLAKLIGLTLLMGSIAMLAVYLRGKS